MQKNAKNVLKFSEKTFESETAQYTIEKIIMEITNLEQLRNIKDLANKRFKMFAQAEGAMLMPGDKVKVTGSNKLEQGSIIKVNRTRAVVNIDGKQWNVPFSMLSKIEENNDTN
tara:strand:+ start:3960 stop:4301 length:342 start_codon:yes stop_codon:yes gene_type:complete